MNWENFWGNDAQDDVASWCEDVYEKAYGKSAVYWQAYDRENSGWYDSLADRPEEYSTGGYTGEFEAWGIDRCTEAIKNGCSDSKTVEEWIRRNPKKEEVNTMEGKNKTVTGYLLEFKKANEDQWRPCEFDCKEESNIWNTKVMGGIELSTVFWETDTQVGFYPALGEGVWVSDSCDWDDRLGAEFDARYTPTEFNSPIGVWGGEVNQHGLESAELWRVRKVTVSAEMSEKAKAFFTLFPTATWEPTVK